MSKFTPGPWHIGMTINDANANTIYRRVQEERFGDKAIAQIYGLPINTPLDEMGRWSNGEDMANARLISAAPQFYEGAIAFAEYIKAMDAGNDIAAMGHFNAAKDLLRLAVKKADGK